MTDVLLPAPESHWSLLVLTQNPNILTALGLEKHETPVTKKVIDEIFEKIINSEGFPAAKISTVTNSFCGIKILNKK